MWLGYRSWALGYQVTRCALRAAQSRRPKHSHASTARSCQERSPLLPWPARRPRPLQHGAAPHLGDAQVVPLVVAAQVEEVALVPRADDAAPRLRARQARRRGPGAHHCLMPQRGYLCDRDRRWGSSPEMSVAGAQRPAVEVPLPIDASIGTNEPLCLPQPSARHPQHAPTLCLFA